MVFLIPARPAEVQELLLKLVLLASAEELLAVLGPPMDKPLAEASAGQLELTPHVESHVIGRDPSTLTFDGRDLQEFLLRKCALTPGKLLHGAAGRRS